MNHRDTENTEFHRETVKPVRMPTVQAVCSLFTSSTVPPASLSAGQAEMFVRDQARTAASSTAARFARYAEPVRGFLLLSSVSFDSSVAGIFWTDRSGGKGFSRFWLGTFIVSLLWTLGGSTPFYRLVYAVVPGTTYFRAPSTMMYVSMFAVAVLAALGTERLLAGQLKRRYLFGWIAAAGSSG